jgi:hypothetical protein
MTKGSFLYILEKRHVHRYTMKANPATDGYVFHAADRGCVNNRCWAVVEDIAYMLDESGIHAFGGDETSSATSQAIADVFGSDWPVSINWAASTYFWCAHYPGQEVIRWFVALSGHSQPRHALVYHIRNKRWWIEEYAIPMGHGTKGYLAMRPIVYLGSESARVLALGLSALDGPKVSGATNRGTITSWTPTSFTDSMAVFSIDLIGAPVSIVSGRGKGQTRVITEVSGTTIKVNLPFLEMLDTTSVYQLGSVGYRYRSSWFKLAESEDNSPRSVEMSIDPVEEDAVADLDFFFDTEEPLPMVTPISSRKGDGVASIPRIKGLTSTKRHSGLVLDLTKPNGVLLKRFDGHREINLDGKRWFSIEISGFTGPERPALTEIVYRGCVE